MADPILTAPSRRATLIGAAGVAAALLAGSAKDPSLSPAIQEALAEWQLAIDTYKARERECEIAVERFDKICPDFGPPGRVRKGKELEALYASRKKSGLEAAEEAASEAVSFEHNKFLKFLSTPPQTAADARLQFKHVAEWIEDMELDEALLTWLETAKKSVFA
jgi:hypothetical protein